MGGALFALDRSEAQVSFSERSDQEMSYILNSLEQDKLAVAVNRLKGQKSREFLKNYLL